MKIIIPLLLVSLILGGCSIVSKTPEPSWKSVRKDGNIEIRAYDPMVVAEVTTTGERYGQPPFQSPGFKLQFGRCGGMKEGAVA